MCSAPLTVSGGVSMEKTASRGLAPLDFVPLSAAGSNLYYPGLFPPARPLLLDALKRRLERHRAGLAHAGAPWRGRGTGVGTHGGQGSPSRAAGATRIPHGPGPPGPRSWRSARPPGRPRQTVRLTRREYRWRNVVVWSRANARPLPRS